MLPRALWLQYGTADLDGQTPADSPAAGVFLFTQNWVLSPFIGLAVWYPYPGRNCP